MSITINNATPSDREILVEMRIRFLNEFMPPDDMGAEEILRENLAKYMQRALESGEYIGLLGYIDGVLASAGGMVVWQLPASYRMMRGRKGYILSIYTIPEFRRKGLCGMMIDEFIRYGKSHEIDTLHLHAGAMGDKIYRKAGFGQPHEPELVIYDVGSWISADPSTPLQG